MSPPTGVARLRAGTRGLLAAAIIAGVSVAVPISTAAYGAAPYWSVTPSPNPGVLSDSLSGISCVTSTSCVAVGSYYNGSLDQTLVETWDGTSWSVTPSPNQGVFGDGLSGVSCVTSTYCVAVGSDTNSGPVYQTLVETWDGTSWSITPSPNPQPGSNVLNGVSCVTSTYCVAVGKSNNGSFTFQNLTLVETWDGTSWSTASGPNQGVLGNTLNGVSCVTSTDCVAVGGSDSGPVFQTLVGTWNGTSWSVTSSPNQGSSDNLLNGVSCVTSTSCMAVGDYYNNNSSVSQTLVETWDGTLWSITPSPDQGSSTNVLNGDSCVTSTYCVAVGYYLHPTLGYQTLIEAWNGTLWSITPSPDQQGSTNGNILSEVTCVSTTSCVAAGYYYNNSDAGQTLVETSSTALAITTTSLPAGTRGQAYSAPMAAMGGNPPYKWKLAPGSAKLPRGLRLNRATGVISGTPKRSGTYTFTVEVLDQKIKTKHHAPTQNTATKVLSITIS